MALSLSCSKPDESKSKTLSLPISSIANNNKLKLDSESESAHTLSSKVKGWKKKGSIGTILSSDYHSDDNSDTNSSLPDSMFPRMLSDHDSKFSVFESLSNAGNPVTDTNSNKSDSGCKSSVSDSYAVTKNTSGETESTACSSSEDNHINRSNSNGSDSEVSVESDSETKSKTLGSNSESDPVEDNHNDNRDNNSESSDTDTDIPVTDLPVPDLPVTDRDGFLQYDAEDSKNLGLNLGSVDQFLGLSQFEFPSHYNTEDFELIQNLRENGGYTEGPSYLDEEKKADLELESDMKKMTEETDNSEESESTVTEHKISPDGFLEYDGTLGEVCNNLGGECNRVSTALRRR